MSTSSPDVVQVVYQDYRGKKLTHAQAVRLTADDRHLSITDVEKRLNTTGARGPQEELRRLRDEKQAAQEWGDGWR